VRDSGSDVSINSSHDASPLDSSYILKKATDQGSGKSGQELIEELDKGCHQLPSTIF